MYVANKSTFSNIFCIFREVKTLKKEYASGLHISTKFLPSKKEKPAKLRVGDLKLFKNGLLNGQSQTDKTRLNPTS